jgi:molybdate transport system substrate-binding protein
MFDRACSYSSELEGVASDLQLVLFGCGILPAVSRVPRTAVSAIVSLLLLPATTFADEIRVITSGAFTAAYLQLVPEFERATGHTIVTMSGASMGSGPNTIPRRLERGEPADVVILAGSALDELITQGKVMAGSRVDLVRSRIGMAVRAGAPRPDISSVDALKRTLLRAKSIAYSSSASGIYLSTELFPRLGIAEQIKGKTRVSEGAVGSLVASGEAEIGFQQISELLPVQGIDYVGPLPAEVQRETVFSAGIVSGARAPEAARAFLRFLTSPAAAPIIRHTGAEPVTAH